MNSQVFTVLCPWGRVSSVSPGKPRRVAGAGGLRGKYRMGPAAVTKGDLVEH